MEAIFCNLEPINQPNVVGQTPLHFSVVWPAAVQLFVDAGADVDATDRSGCTPIFYAATHCVPKSIKMLGRANCLLTRCFNESVSRQGVHGLFEEPSALLENDGQLVRSVLADTLSDRCDCACSIEGCRTCTMLIKEATTWRYTGPSNNVPRLSQFLIQKPDVDTPSLAWLRREIVRFSTFWRLDLDHTCCGWDPFENIVYGPDDKEKVDEMKEEQSKGLDKLETLLVEFEDKYNESTCSFTEFLKGYWDDRMLQVLGPSEEPPIDHEALENLGD